MVVLAEMNSLMKDGRAFTVAEYKNGQARGGGLAIRKPEKAVTPIE
jgi:hypothetical protein